MQAVIFAIHLIISLALVGVILLQRSEGGALGIGGGGSNAMVSGRGAASLLTRSTAILATLFFITSLTLAALAGIKKKNDGLNLDAPLTSTAPLSAPLSAPLTAPAPAETLPAAPATPAIPEKSSALELAPKPTAAAASPAATPAAVKPAAVKPAAKPAAPAASAKPSIPEPTVESVPVPFNPGPAGPSEGGSNDAAGGGGSGPQPR